jgi:ribosomal protein L29
VTGEIENPLRIRHIRKDIARVLTVMNQKLKVESVK